MPRKFEWNPKQGSTGLQGFKAGAAKGAVTGGSALAVTANPLAIAGGILAGGLIGGFAGMKAAKDLEEANKKAKSELGHQQHVQRNMARESQANAQLSGGDLSMDDQVMVANMGGVSRSNAFHNRLYGGY